MSWHDVEPLVTRSTAHAVTATATLGRGGMFPKLTIIIRPALVDTPPAWLVAGAPVKVQVGRDANRGKLRVLPGGHMVVRVSPGRGATGVVIRVPGLPGTTCHKDATPLEYDYNDEWFEVDLPAWMPDGAPLPPVAAPTPRPPSLIGKPFSMTEGAVLATRRV